MKINKILTTGLGAVAISLGGLALGADNSQAAVFQFSNAAFTDGGTITGTFDYTAGVYSAFNIVTTAGSAVTTGSVYQSPTAISPSNFPGIPANSGTQLTVQASSATSNVGLLNLVFSNDLSTLSLGETSTIQIGSVGPLGFTPSYEFYSINGSDAGQARAVSGGVVQAVPEPLTILGAMTAVAFGAAFKRRDLTKSQKG